MNTLSWTYLFCCLLALALCPQITVAKEKMLFDEMDPTVSYSAWRTVETADASIKMREYHSPGKTRFEMSQQGIDMIMIHRGDTGESWMLMPEMNRYMKTSSAQMVRSSGSGFTIEERTEMGKETVNGYETTKFRAIFKDLQGNKGGGYFWVTEMHGIPIKTDMIQKTAKGKERIYMELTDLMIGPQPDSLFEVPDSYELMQAMPGMGGMAGMDSLPSDMPEGYAGQDPDKAPGLNPEQQRALEKQLNEMKDDVGSFLDRLNKK